jgi:hypothetical protein
MNHFIQGPLKKNEAMLARSFTFTFRYIDDVLSINNCKCGDFVDRLYPNELEIKHTTDTVRSASYLDLHLVYTPYTGAAGMLLHINEKFTMGKMK